MCFLHANYCMRRLQGILKGTVLQLQHLTSYFIFLSEKTSKSPRPKSEKDPKLN